MKCALQFCSLAGISSLLLVTLAHAQSETQTYQYDALGRVISTSSTNGQTSAVCYDDAGNRTRYLSRDDGSTVECAPPNVPPIAVNDTASFPCNGTGRVFNPRVNDSDADGHPLTITAVTRLSGSALLTSFNATSVTFNMNRFRGTSVFRYTISDGNGGTAQANISITGTAVFRRC